MTNREIKSVIDSIQSIAPQAIAADTNGTGIDLQGFDSATILLDVGAGTSLTGSNYYEFEVEESDDNSAWTDVADADLTDTVTGTNTGTIAKIDDAAEDDTTIRSGYIGSKRYIRVVANEQGTGASIIAGAIVLRGNPANAPV